MPRFHLRAAHGVLLGLLAAVAAVGPFAPTQPALGRAPAPLPSELSYVPHDAAFFLHANVARIWDHDATKAFRAADKSAFATLEDMLTKLTGAKPEDFKTVTYFLPTVKGPQDTGKLGLVLTFKKPFDAKKLEAGVAESLPKNDKIKVLTPAATTAVVLVGLGDEYGKPRKADESGPLTAALAAAATGTHTLVTGATFANLPDVLRQENDLPGPIRAFQPIFLSESLTATVDLGDTLALDVRVKSNRAAQAVDAEKALAALVKLVSDEADGGLKEIEKDAADDPGLKDLLKVLKALTAAAQGAKFAVDGTEARMTASLPLAGLPLAGAYSAAVLKVEGATANLKSSNNLKQIALAMHGYHDATGAMPPAAVCDKKGKPQLSWRVLILPYIEQDALYKQFKLDEPWDSDNNKKLLAKMPAVYAMPGKTKPGGTDTYYRVFVGNGAGFDWLTGTKLTDVSDGTSNTILCVTAATAVPWTKPDELEFDPDKDMGKLMGMVNGRAQVAMMDGSVRRLSKLPKKETLNALITKGGGEVVGDDF